MLSLQHSHGYSGSFLNYITMDNRFLDLIERSMKEHWDLPAFSDYNGHTFHFKDVARRIEKFHILLEHAGIKKGDKVAIVGRNSSNWAICFFGILAYGAVAVPILHEFKPDNIHHIVNHSGAKAVLAGSSNWENMNEKMMPDVKLFMMLDNFSIIDCKNKEVRTIRDRINEYFGKKYPRSFTANDVKYHIEDPEELAVLNYTSGTTSFSKGVMIPYRSLWSNTQFAYDRLPFIHPGDNIVCMLPMAHMYGLAFEVLNSVNKGCHVHFLTRTPSPKIIAEALIKARSGGSVIFAGDGINDAPVLTRADAGIAMGTTGSDAAIEAADAVIMNDDPQKVAEAVKIARKTMGIVRQNIVFALSVKALFLGLGAAGMMTMWGAVFADVGVTMLAVLNALRAFRKPI